MSTNAKLQQIGERLTMLRARLRAREGRPNYEQNVLDLKDEIERLEKSTAEIAALGETEEPE